MTLIDVVAGSQTFKAVVLESPETLPSIGLEEEVTVLFKETEVIIALDPVNGISLRNRLLCEIQEIQMGNLLCNLTLHHDIGIINSIITRNAVEDLKLKKGLNVWAMIKTNEIMLEFK